MQNIGAVILAAGESSRFGQPKQLLPFRGKTLVRTIIDATCEAGCAPVVVVIGSNGETIHAELAHANVLEVRNTNWRSGIGSSIRSGVRALTGHAPDVQAILLLVCDQPAVNAPFIERFDRNAPGIKERRRSLQLCEIQSVSLPFLIVPFLRNCSH